MNEKKISLIDFLCLKYPEITKKELFSRILCGEVYVNNEKILDAKRLIKINSSINFKYKQYVSRGGIKLAHVLKKWNLNVRDKVFIDAGASTGGFTDCLLKHGARFVHAVDVGHNQIAYSLRINSHVQVHERTNILSIQPDSLDPPPYAAVCDLSFRSIYGVVSHILDLISSDALIALIKPQFEWVNPEPGFNGVIKNVDKLTEICTHLVRKLYSHGIFISRVELSPIMGTKGNREIFFLLHKKNGYKIGDVISLLTSLIFSLKK